jgi:hypothetical protein
MKRPAWDCALMVILELLCVYLWFYLRGTTLPVFFVATALVPLRITDYDLRNIHQDIRIAMKGIDVNTRNIAFTLEVSSYL